MLCYFVLPLTGIHSPPKIARLLQRLGRALLIRSIALCRNFYTWVCASASTLELEQQNQTLSRRPLKLLKLSAFPFHTQDMRKAADFHFPSQAADLDTAHGCEANSAPDLRLTDCFFVQILRERREREREREKCTRETALTSALP